jgi:hypothetical protein
VFSLRYGLNFQIFKRAYLYQKDAQPLPENFLTRCSFSLSSNKCLSLLSHNFLFAPTLSLSFLCVFVSEGLNPVNYDVSQRYIVLSFPSLYCCCCCGDVGPLRSSRLGGLQRDGAALGGLGGNNSDVSGNDSTVFVGRASAGVRSGKMQSSRNGLDNCFF